MNNHEAINVLFNEWRCIDRNDGIHCDRKCESCDLVMDVEIIREAYNMAISALEKQIPKKPGYTKLMYKCNGEDIEINHPECPYCRTHGFSLWDAAIPVGDKYCKRCGQAIDWEGEGC